jgi:GNAT superfamily N-acetyltransferase
MIRRAERDADLAAFVEVWNAITPAEPTSVEVVRERWAREPVRLYVVAERDGAIVGAGFAGPSDSPGRGFLSPRVLPGARRGGTGTALLRALADHLAASGFDAASGHVDGGDAGSLAFARRHGFEVVDRQVEQVRVVADEPAPPVPAGLELVSVAERPELLARAYHEVAVEAYAGLPLSMPVEVSLEDWLHEEATLPEGSFVALAAGEVVGYAGLLRLDGGRIAEHGLTAVRSDHRRRGIATLLKRAQLAWAAANGLERLATWTQTGNEGMQAVNERLGYRVESVCLSVRAPLPLR